MKKLLPAAAALLLLTCNLQLSTSRAQGTAFTYQGRLSSGNTGVTGLFDFRFAAYNAASGGGQIGSTVNATAVGVTNGLFNATLDFGVNVFTGPARFLDLAARTNGSAAAFVSMTPRQALTPAPYATYAVSAASVSGSFSGDVTGPQGAAVVTTVGGYGAATVASGASAANAAGSANIPGTIVKRDGAGNFAAGNMNGSFTGNGAGITNLPTTGLVGTISGSQIGASAVGSAQLNTGSGPATGQVLSYNGTGLAWSFPAGTAGANIFTNSLTVGTTAGQFTVQGENGVALALAATGGPNPGHVRFRNALEVFPSTNGSAAGSVDVRNTNGAATIALRGDIGSITASNLTTVGDITTTSGKLAVTGAAGTLTIQGENGAAVAIAATGGLAPGHIRLRNALEVSPSADGSAAGYLDVRNAGGTTIALHGDTGGIEANNLAATGDIGTTGGKLAMNSSAGNLTIQGEGGVAVAIAATGGLASGHIRLRNALEIQPSADASTAGSLDVRNTNGSATITLNGDHGNVTTAGNMSVGGNLSANNTPGVNYSQVGNGSEAIAVTSANPVMICSEGNAKPAPGFFVINAYVTGDFQGNYVYLDLCDVSGASPVVLAEVGQKASIGTFDFYNLNTLNLSWVVPITNANGYQNFGLRVTSSGNDTKIYGHNLTVLYVPRQNN